MSRRTLNFWFLDTGDSCLIPVKGAVVVHDVHSTAVE